MSVAVLKYQRPEFKKKKKLQKEHFYPNHYHKDVLHECVNEVGSIISNPNYNKVERKKISRSIKRLRDIALFPYCSKHYFGMN